MKSLSTQYAQTQSDLVDMSLDKDTVQEEFMADHHLTATGWYKTSPGVDRSFMKLEAEELEQAIRCLFQLRPTARTIDIKPEYGTVTEHTVMNNNPAGYRLSMAEKAELIAKQFLRNPDVQGFKYELNNIDSDAQQSSMTLVMYTVRETSQVDFIPCSVFYKWRKNF